MSKCNLCNDSGFVQGVEIPDVGKTQEDAFVYATVRPCTCQAQQVAAAKMEFPKPNQKKKWWEESR
jgi:hypothetical protein